MAKRFREFKRFNFTAKIGKFIQASLVDKTFEDHYGRCADDPYCCHHGSGSLYVARLVEANISVGKKRGYLDIPAPCYQSKPEEQIGLLETLIHRLRAFARDTEDLNPRTREFLLKLSKEIDEYAHRNAMEVLAETVVDRD